ncbi:MAG: hypothetical protein II119_02830 [Bacilli bacterium]|nr:hypothetical protein [Bacilli bacterium]MBQ6282576.1 hypothetical protein [Bacilli bacterium]
MTEEVRKLLLEASKELEKEDKQSDSIIYEQAANGSNKISYIVWKSLLEEWREAALGSEITKKLKVLPPEKINLTSRDLNFGTRDECTYAKKQIRMASRFNVRHDDSIAFVIEGKKITPILTKYMIGTMQDDGLNVSVATDGMICSTSTEKFEEIMRQISKKPSIYSKGTK